MYAFYSSNYIGLMKMFGKPKTTPLKMQDLQKQFNENVRNAQDHIEESKAIYSEERFKETYVRARMIASDLSKIEGLTCQIDKEKLNFNGFNLNLKSPHFSQAISLKYNCEYLSEEILSILKKMDKEYRKFTMDSKIVHLSSPYIDERESLDIATEQGMSKIISLSLKVAVRDFQQAEVNRFKEEQLKKMRKFVFKS